VKLSTVALCTFVLGCARSESFECQELATTIESDFTFAPLNSAGTSAASVVIANSTSTFQTVEVSGVFENEKPAAFVETSFRNVSMQPCSTSRLILTATPKTVGFYEIVLKIRINTKETNLTFRGQVAGPHLALPSLSVMNLGALSFSPQRSVQGRDVIRLLNNGNQPLQVQVQGESGGEFCLTDIWSANCPMELSVLLEPNETQFIRFAVRPNGIGVKKWILHLNTNEPFQPKHQIEVLSTVLDSTDCQLGVPSYVEFILNPENQKYEAFLRLKNNGTTVCVARDFRIEGPWANSVQVDSKTKIQIAPGESKDIPLIGFGARDPMPSFVSFSSSTGEQRVMLYRNEIKTGCLEFANTAYSGVQFWNVCQGSSVDRKLAIRNVCAFDVTLESFSSQCTEGDCSTVSLLAPAVLRAFSDQQITLTFAPNGESAVSGIVRMTTVDVLNQRHVLAIPFGGAGLFKKRTTVEFVERRPKADVLFAIDTSPSFAAQLQRVKTELSLIFDHAGCGVADIRYSIVSCDTSVNSGVLLPGASGKKRFSSPADKNDFLSAIPLVSSPSENETCLQSVRDAMANGDFLRNDAMLGVVVISDAVDHSQNPNALVNALQNLGRDVTYSVIGPSVGCEEDASNGVHELATSSLNGTSLSVCSNNWYSAFQNVDGCANAGPRSTFSLNATPETNSVVVFSNGKIVPQFESSGARNWALGDYGLISVEDVPAFAVGENGRHIRIEFAPADQCQ
jgi:hypothetical protein